MTDLQEPQLKRIHPLDMPLEVFVEDLSTRPRNIINAEMGYFTYLGDEYIKPPLTVRHLLMFSRKELRKWPNLGKRSLNEIEEMLRNRGLQLWDEHDERSLRLLREHSTYFQEPVQQPFCYQDGRNIVGKEYADHSDVFPLYAAPPQRPAEPVQEPYCYVYEYDGVFGLHREFYPREYNGRKPDRTVPLFTSAPQRKPLTEEEIEKAYREIWRTLPSDFDHTSSGWIEQGIRYAERAHGIK